MNFKGLKYIESILIKIPGKPQSQLETRFKGHAYTPTEKKEYMRKCVSYMKPFAGFSFSKDDFIYAEFEFILPRPQDLKGNEREYCNKRPDADDLVKTPQDCLHGKKLFKTGKRTYFMGSNVIMDDGQIFKVTSTKYYHATGKRPKTIIRIHKYRRESPSRNIQQTLPGY